MVCRPFFLWLTREAHREHGRRRREAESADEVQSADEVLSFMRSAIQDGNRVTSLHRQLQGLPSLQQGIDAATIKDNTATMTWGASELGRFSSTGCDEGKCMVCQDSFQEGNSLRILPCLHRYHVQCIDRWLGQDTHCPVCKHDVTQSS